MLASFWLAWDRYQERAITRRIERVGGSVVRSRSLGWVTSGRVAEVILPWSKREAISPDDLDRLSALTRLTFRNVRPARNGVVPTVRFDSMTIKAAYSREALGRVWEADLDLYGNVTFEFE
jgi:hypothetical protein